MNSRLMADDQYYTPNEVVWAQFEWLLKHLKIKLADYDMWDPFAGGGVYAEVATGYKWNQIIESDLHPCVSLKPGHGIRVLDFFKTGGLLGETLPFEKPVIIISNPPFGVGGNKIIKILKHAASLPNVAYLCFLVPAAFDYSGGRRLVAQKLIGRVTYWNYIENKTFKLESKYMLFQNCAGTSSVLTQNQRQRAMLKLVKQHLVEAQDVDSTADWDCPDPADPDAIVISRGGFQSVHKEPHHFYLRATDYTPFFRSGKSIVYINPQLEAMKPLLTYDVIIKAFKVSFNRVHWSWFRWMELPEVKPVLLKLLKNYE